LLLALSHVALAASPELQKGGRVPASLHSSHNSSGGGDRGGDSGGGGARHSLRQAGTQLQQAQAASAAAAGSHAGAASSGSGSPRCQPRPTKELFAARAAAGNATVLLAVMNAAQWDFGMNWLHHVKALTLDWYVIAAADAASSQRLAAAGEPCFEWVDEEAPKLGE
jgi:hypothetical protein